MSSKLIDRTRCAAAIKLVGLLIYFAALIWSAIIRMIISPGC